MDPTDRSIFFDLLVLPLGPTLRLIPGPARSSVSILTVLISWYRSAHLHLDRFVPGLHLDAALLHVHGVAHPTLRLLLLLADLGDHGNLLLPTVLGPILSFIFDTKFVRRRFFMTTQCI